MPSPEKEIAEREEGEAREGDRRAADRRGAELRRKDNRGAERSAKVTCRHSRVPECDFTDDLAKQP